MNLISVLCLLEDGIIETKTRLDDLSVNLKDYNIDQKAEFLAEVEGAAAYVTAMGW